MSRRVPTGPLLRNAAQQAANVLQERRQGVLVGGSDRAADSGFDWANSSYDRNSRGIRIWLYAIDLRVSLALLDQKWSYLLGAHSIKSAAQAALQSLEPCPAHSIYTDYIIYNCSRSRIVRTLALNKRCVRAVLPAEVSSYSDTKPELRGSSWPHETVLTDS